MVVSATGEGIAAASQRPLYHNQEIKPLDMIFDQALIDFNFEVR